MNGSEIAVLVAIIVVIVLAVSAGRRRSGRQGDDEYPWWTLGLFAVGSKAEEEAQEARMDAQLAGEPGVDATPALDDDRQPADVDRDTRSEPD